MQTQLGLGIGFRPEIAHAIDQRRDLGFIEVMAEAIEPTKPVPQAIRNLQDRGVKVVPHGVTLSLGGAEPLDLWRVKHLAEVARRVGAPLVSEHIAYVRAGGTELGHLTPIPRTKASLAVLVENVKRTIDALPVPLALENISSLFDWPDAEMDEAAFVVEVLKRTGALMLLDLSNVHANAVNLGTDPVQLLSELPLERLAYVHVGGGVEKDGVYMDTHAHSVPPQALQLVEELASRVDPLGFMLERDENSPPVPELMRELDDIKKAVSRGRERLKHAE